MFDLLAAALFLDPAVVEGFLLTIPSVSFIHKLIIKNAVRKKKNIYVFAQGI